MKKLLTLCTLLFVVIFTSPAMEKLTLEKVEQKPVLDGVLNDVCWQNKAWHSNFSKLGEPKIKAAVQTRFKMCHDNKFIYIGIEVDEPKPESIVKSKQNFNGSKSIWKNDSVELFFDPIGKGNSFYQIFLSSTGKVADAYAEDDNTGQSKFTINYNWDGQVKAKNITYKNKWVTEVAIPLAGFKLNRNSLHTWKFNIGRTRYASDKVEYTSFSPLKSLRFAYPLGFCDLFLNRINLAPFGWTITEIKSSVAKHNKQLLCKVSGKIFNNTGNFSIALLNIGFINSNNKIVYKKKITVPVRNESEQPFKLSIPVKNKSANRIRVIISSLSAREAPLLIFTDKLNLEYSPLRVKLLKPTYRNNIYASQNCEKIVANLSLDFPHKYSLLTATLCGPDKFNKIKKITALKKNNIVEFDTSTLKNGNYFLKVNLINSEKTVGHVNVPIKKLPYLKGEVWLDKNGVVHVDGKKFLPFGWFRGPAKKKTGFTVAQNYSRFTSEEHMQNFLDRMHKAGLKALVIPCQLLSKNAYTSKLFHHKNQRNIFTKEQKQQIIKVVKRFRNHPGLFGWYISDEPEGRDISAAWLEKAYKLIRETDPYHPCILVNFSPAGIKTYYKACDILMPDCYPNYIKGSNIPLGKQLQETAYYVKTASKLKPSWLAPQAFCWYYPQRPELICRAPNFDEIRNQVYQTFASNGKGILLYDYHDWSSMYYSLRQGIDYIADEVKILKPYLLGNNLNIISFQTNRKNSYLVAAVKKHADNYCLIAVNTLPTVLDVTFKFKSGILPANLYLSGSNSTQKISRNTLKVKLAPYETRIYLTDRQTAEQLPSPQKNRKHLEELDKSRFKTGNLVAMGEIMTQEYRNFLKKPPVSPVNLKTSSTVYSFFQRNSAYEYVLFDGMTDNYFLPFVWGPKKNDNAPWLLLTFPKPEMVSKVVLYSLKFKDIVILNDFTVQAEVNGKFQTVGKVTENSNVKTTVDFPTVKTCKIKILINKFKKFPKSANRILTEIEVYSTEK